MKKNWGKRFLSLLLTGVMMISSAYVGNAEVNPGASDSVTTGAVVAANYTGLTEIEAAIMSNTGLKGDVITYTAPGDTSLIIVNAEEKTVTAETYTDSDGNVWKPVKAYVEEGNSKVEISDFTNGTGSFDELVQGENYTIKVTYQLAASVDTTLQQELLNAPYNLVTAVKDFEKLADAETTFAELTANNDIYETTGYGNNIIQLLKALADGDIKYTAGTLTAKVTIKNDAATIEAINDLYTETSNGDDEMLLASYIDDYINNYRTSAKQAYVVDASAVSAAAQAKDTYEKLNTIVEGEGMAGVQSTLSDLVDWGIEGASTALFAMNSLMATLGEMRDAIATSIVEDVAAVQGLMTTPSNSSMSALIDLALESEDSVKLHDDITLTEKLTVAETTLTSNVNRHTVKVYVYVNVIEESSTDINIPKEGYVYRELQVNDGVNFDGLAEILERENVESSALALIEEIYGLKMDDVNNYVRMTTDFDIVSGDMDFKITYMPKEYTLVLEDDKGQELSNATVYYGYNYKLPASSDADKSYDYAVNGSGFTYKEGDIVKVTDNTTVTRKEGKAKVTDRLLNVLAADINYGFSTDAKAILANEAVKSDEVAFRAPDSSDAETLVTVKNAEKEGVPVYEVTAGTYESGIVGMVWQPVSVDAYIDGKVDANYKIAEATFPSEGVEKVVVHYELKITQRDNGDTAGITDADMLEYANIPYVLATEAKEQITNIKRLAAQYANLNMGSRIHFLLGGLSADETVSAESKTAISNLLGNGFNSDKSLKLYTMASRICTFNADGALTDIDLAAYYSGLYASLEEQVQLLINNLSPILVEQAFLDLLRQEAPEYEEKLTSVMDSLKAMSFTGPNAVIDLEADASEVAELMSLLKGKELAGPDLSQFTQVTTSKGLTTTAAVEKEAEGKVSVTLQMDVFDSAGNLANSYTSEKIVIDMGVALGDAQVKSLEEALANLEAKIPNKNHYEYDKEIDLPGVGDVYTRNVTIVGSMVPKTYTVYVQDEGETAVKLADIAIDNNKVILAGAPTGYEYTYTIGNEVKSVGNTDISFVFTVDKLNTLFAESDELVITRTKTNVSVEGVQNFVDAINDGLTGSGSQAILLEDANAEGNLAIVLRTTLADLQANAKDILMAVGMAVIGEPYVGMNGQAFYDTDGSLYLQTLVDAVMASGIGMDRFNEVIKDDGTVNQLTLNGYKVIGGSTSATLGGSLIEIELELLTSTGASIKLPLYITLDDSGNVEQLAQVKSLLQKAQPWVDANTELADAADATSGRLKVEINDNTAANTLYELLITGLLVLEDFNTLEDITDVELAALVDYVKTKAEAVILDEAFTAQTIENTIATAGYTYDLSGYEDMINRVLNLLRNLDDYATITEVATEEDYLYDLDITVDGIKLKELLINNLNLPEILGNAIKDTEIQIDVTFESEDIRDNAYEAMILDNSKSGVAKFDLVEDAAAGIAEAGNNAIVVLLDNVEGDITINNGIILNLNGKNVNGNIINANTENAVNIIDNALDTTGTVTGTLTGKFVVTAGTYAQGIDDSMIAAGYILEGNTVKNAIYTLEEDANGNITVKVDATFVAEAAETDMRNFALDLGVKLALNYYTWASLNIEECGDIYDITIEDALATLNSGKEDIINEAIDLFKLPGIQAFANMVIADFTDFGALASSIENESALATYSFTTNPWDVLASLKGEGADNYVAVGVGSNKASEHNGTITLVATGTESQRKSAADLLKELDKIVVKKDIVVDELTDINYVDGSIQVDAHATVDVEVDLTQDDRYTTIIGVVLAYQNQDNTALVDGLKAWVDEKDVEGLKSAVESMTIADIISSLKASKGVAFDTMLAALDMEDAEAAELEAIYHAYLNATYTMLIKLDITGNNSVLPKFVENGKVLYGTYGASKTDWNKMDITLKVKMFTAVPSITVSVKSDNTAFYGWKNPEDDNIIYVDLKDSKIGIAGLVNGIDEFYNQLVVTVTNGTELMHEYTYSSKDNLVGTGTVLSITAENAESGARTTEEYKIVVLGDVNGNGTMDVADMSLIHRHIIFEDKQLVALPLEAADFNFNGTVEVADVSLMHRRELELVLVEAEEKNSFLPLTK